METACQTDDSIVTSLQDYVRTPIVEAEQAVETEYEEVKAERRAFRRFKDRVSGIETVSTSRTGPTMTQHALVVEARSRERERVRQAFRETVMSLDHYETVYGESLEEHVAAELSPEVAAGLQSDSSTPFTDLYKATLTAAIDSAIAGREGFCEKLDTELSSLDASKTAIDEVLADCDPGCIPLESRGDLQTRLETIAQRRQKTIQRRDPTSFTDGHDFCRYLYCDYQWRYPVLTAVARLRISAF